MKQDDNLKGFVFMGLFVVMLFFPLGILATISRTVTAAPAADFDCTQVTQIPFSECEALVTMYNDMDGDTWFNVNNWLQTNTPCGIGLDETDKWEGIFCANGHVKTVTMYTVPGSFPAGFGIKGELSPAIGNLSHLERISLAWNDISSLPPEIGNLSNLVILDFFLNNLTGLPPEIGNLNNLTTLYLSNNGLTSLPSEIGNLNNLVFLDIADNQLTSLPPEMWNLNNLTRLYLAGNALTSLSTEIENLSNLEILHLSETQLTNLPPEIGNLGNLRTLYLSNNGLTSLPSEIGNLNNLVFLDIAENQLTSLPPEIGNLNNLSELNLIDNNLTSLPPEIGSLSSLGELYLSRNPLRGPFPESLTNADLFFFYYEETDLCALSERGDDLWLEMIAYHKGNGLSPCVSQIVSGTAATLSSSDGFVQYEFAANTFTDTVELIYQPLYYTIPEFDSSQDWLRFTLMAEYTATNDPALPTKPYTITVNYEMLPIIPGTGQLYYSDGTQWITNVIPTTETDTSITLVVDNLSNGFQDWMLSGESERIYLPMVRR